MTDLITADEAIETVLAMAMVQDGYAKKAADPGLKLIHKANAKAQRQVAAAITRLSDGLAQARAACSALLEGKDAMENCWKDARADAKAAQAMVVERAAELCDRVAAGYEKAGDAAIGCGVRLTGANIRSLADTDGLALVREQQELLEAVRAQRDKAVGLAETFEADRDRLAAANAALEAQVARLVGALEPFRLMSGELFARNWNASDVVIALDNPDDPPRLTFCDFLELHAALAAVQADARREGGE